MIKRVFLISILMISTGLANQITYKSKKDFKMINIENGRITYLKSKGYGITADFKKIQPTDKVEFFLDFEKKKLTKDVTENYRVKSYHIIRDDKILLHGSYTGGFLNPQHKIIVKVHKRSWLDNKIDLGSFYIDFYLHPNFFNKAVILKKGVFFEDQFYGIIVSIKNKKIVYEFKNVFYDEDGKSYTKIITSSSSLQLKKWQHIGLIFNRVNGKLKIYLDGILDKEEIATIDGKVRSEILVPHFLKFDGSDLVLFDEYFGYCDNLRIGRTAEINFTKYLQSIKEEVILTSPLINLKHVNSEIRKMTFKIKDAQKGIIVISLKQANNLDRMSDASWKEMDFNVNNDRYYIKDLPEKCKYFQWKINIIRNPKSNKTPTFYLFNLDYRENVPPLPPKNIKVLEYKNTIKLKWDKNLEEDLLGYVLYWGMDSKNYENKVDLGLKNDYILDSLIKRQNYYFAIKAYDSKDPYNLSEFSKEIHVFKK